MEPYLHLQLQWKSQSMLNMILLIMKCEFIFDSISLNYQSEPTKFTSRPTKGSQTGTTVLWGVSGLKVAFQHTPSYTKWGAGEAVPWYSPMFPPHFRFLRSLEGSERDSREKHIFLRSTWIIFLSFRLHRILGEGFFEQLNTDTYVSVIKFGKVIYMQFCLHIQFWSLSSSPMSALFLSVASCVFKFK